MTRPALRRGRGRASAEGGWTLVEVLLLIALLGIIAMILVPVFVQILERAKVRRAIADMRLIEFEVNQFKDLDEHFPMSLDELPPRPRIDPWGRPYVYFVFEGAGWRGRARKDRFLVPINTFYDLYSLGPDGDSRAPLQNPVSLDDVVRANDGQFYGLGRDF